MELDASLKAYEDVTFLKRDELRAVRLQTEFLKPAILMDEHRIRSTVCVFGSARILGPEEVARLEDEVEKAVAKEPQAAATAALQQRLERARHDLQYYDMARRFAAEITELGQANGALDMVITTGGGPGIMEAANRGAAEVGGKSIGLNITLKYEQFANPYITPELNFTLHYFAIRKIHFLIRAVALCAFPGGFGTMDELFETLTLIQTEKSARIPIILFGREFWEQLINWDLFVERGMISPEDLDLIQYAETVEEAVAVVRSAHPLPPLQEIER